MIGTSSVVPKVPSVRKPCDEISDAFEMNYATVAAILSLLKGIGAPVSPSKVLETGERPPTRQSLKGSEQFRLGG